MFQLFFKAIIRLFRMKPFREVQVENSPTGIYTKYLHYRWIPVEIKDGIYWDAVKYIQHIESERIGFYIDQYNWYDWMKNILTNLKNDKSVRNRIVNLNEAYKYITKFNRKSLPVVNIHSKGPWMD